MPHPLSAGGTVGRLKVERTLTLRGKHLQTFLASDTQSGQVVVLKEVRDDLRLTPAEKQALQDDIRALAGLKVPGIQPIRGVIPHEGRSYLILGHLPGQSLRSVLGKQPRLTVDQATKLLSATLTVLQGLHNEFPSVLHLDVTPENILMSGWDKVSLVDGNWLRRLGNPFSDVSPFDVAYAAPELQRGQPMPASDIYALGITIVEALTGNPAGALYKADTNRISWEPIANPVLQSVLIRMTENSLSSRFESVEQVLEALNSGVPVSLPQTNQPAQPVPAVQPQAQPMIPPQPSVQNVPLVPPQPPQPVQAPRLTASAQAELVQRVAPPPPPPPVEVVPPPAPEPPPRRDPPKIVEDIDDVSTEEGLDALMALYEAQNM